jgi:hypothetical protein
VINRYNYEEQVLNVKFLEDMKGLMDRLSKLESYVAAK